MRADERLTLALVAASLASATALIPLTQDRLYLGLLLALTLTTAALAVIARRLRVPEAISRLISLAPGLAGVALFNRLTEMFTDTTDFVAGAFAPMPEHDGFRLLSVLVLWLLYVIAETVSVGLRKPAWSFPVLILPYLIPAIVLPSETGAGYLLLATGGYVLVLAVGTFNRFADTPRPGLRRGISLAAAVSLVGAWSLTGLTLALLPERTTGPLDPGKLNSAVQLGDPTLDLIRNLRAPSDRVVISYRSSDGEGRYLRLAALPSFDAAGFHLISADLMPGAINPPSEATRFPAVKVDVQVKDFGSEWLPVPWVPSSVDANGDWRVDPGTLAIVAVGDNRKLATRYLDYSVTSRDLRPDPALVAASQAGDPGDGGLTLALPPELDPEVVELARKMTAKADTDGERVLALLTWLRSKEFTYSTDIIEGTTMGTVSDFLLSSRTGYCEQFSGSLAIMARSLGIPSRAVIGFLPGHQVGDRYEVAVKDMHAWTEVYLSGLGWVAFDPTPSGAAGVAPVPTPTTKPSRSAAPSTPPPPTRRAQDPGASTPATPTTATSFTLPAWSWAVIGALVLAATPALVRRGQRWRRLRPGRAPVRMAEDAWDELRDSVVDAGLTWPDGTPRQIAASLALVLDPDTTQAVRKLADEVERARFAPALESGSDLAGWLASISTGLGALRSGASPLRRVFPRSVIRPRR